MLQDLVGTPSGKVVMAALICCKPKATVPPEPLVSRDAAPLKLELVLEPKASTWTLYPWQKYSTVIYNKAPDWTIIVFGREASEHDMTGNTASPLDTVLAQRQSTALGHIALPEFLRTLAEGSEEERLKMILLLHKRLYHKPPDDLRRTLVQAGAPLHSSSLVSKAVAMCDVCNTWAKAHAKPTMKTLHSARFNAIVYIDLIYFDRFIVFIGVDEAIRFTVLAIADYKDTHSLMTIFRREWIRWFGPPRVVRSDKEGAFSGDECGIEFERLGIQRQLVVAGQQHSYLGILDRRVQIVRHFLPRLMQQLSEEAVFCEAEDAVSECQFCVNSLMLY